MINKLLVSLIAVLTSAFICVQSSDANAVSVLSDNDTAGISGVEYAYVTMSGARLAIRLSGEVILGDYGISAKICPKSSNYYCVNSNIFKFAVPKKIKNKDHFWVVDGIRYDVIESLRSIIMFGKEIQIIVISTTDRTHKENIGTMFYYYSPEYGLMGFQGVNNKLKYDTNSNGLGFYVLTNKRGFGARSIND